MFSDTTKHNLVEIRFRLIYCVISYFLLFVTFFYCSHYIFKILSEPLLAFLPGNSSLIATDVLSPVVMPIKLAMNLAFFANIPIIFYQTWKFIAPGLYKNEKKYIIPLVSVSLLLFLLGLSFAYTIALPMMFQIFIAWLPQNVAIMADINNYLDFIFNMLFIFGFVFEIPLIIIILAKLNIITAKQLAEIRPYFTIVAFIISMLLTPPDVISMIMLALPICLLYETGVLIVRCLGGVHK